MTRQPEATGDLAIRFAQRHGGGTVGSTSAPSGDLLPADGFLAPAPVLAPARALASEAIRLLRVGGDPARRPARWSQPAFRREIELVHAHLAPLRSRKALAASYGREAFHLTLHATARDDPGAVRLAYALRWVELGGGDPGAIWPATAAREQA